MSYFTQVRLDGWINLEMPADIAAKILTLRPCLEALIMRGAAQPGSVTKPQQQDEQVSLSAIFYSQIN